MKKLFGTLFVLTALLLSLYLIGKKTNIFKKASSPAPYKQSNINADISNSFPYQRNWKYLAQGGESPKETLSEVVPQVRVLSPSYIRIDHVFDFYSPVSKNIQGSLIFDWTRLDKELLAIRSMGAKPFVSLSYMPPAISSGTEVDIPDDWKDWQESVKGIIEHISGKNGLGVRDAYYEVWNEPDLFGKWTIGGEKNYLDLYRYASHGATGAKNVHDFYFGGPATTTSLESWTRSLIETVMSENLRLDFISWHRYSYDIVDFENDVLQVSSWVSSYPKYASIPFIISEAGINSELDPSYDTALSAIHTLALHTALIGNPVKIFEFEIKDGLGPSKFWGRWGILTHEDFGKPEPKPRYQALEFLDKMAGQRVVVTGQGSNVFSFATIDKKSKTFDLLLVNYDKSGSLSENVPIAVSGFPKAPVVEKIEFLGKEGRISGNFADGKWTGVIPMLPNTAFILRFSGF